MTLRLPDAHERLRCNRCGNLTRFDVVRTSTVREFWHADMSGSAAIDSSTTLVEEITSITCRWCNTSDGIEMVARPAQ